MAGWISSKLKVAETFLQQIDQQAAESLGKNEKPRSEDLNQQSQKIIESVVPLKDQLKKRTPPEIHDLYGQSREDSVNDRSTEIGTPPKPPLNNPTTSSPLPTLTDSDWTELLGSPKQTPPPGPNYTNGISRIRGPRKDLRKPLELKKNQRSHGSISKSMPRSSIASENGINGGAANSKHSDGEESGLGDSVEIKSGFESHNGGLFVVETEKVGKVESRNDTHTLEMESTLVSSKVDGIAEVKKQMDGDYDGFRMDKSDTDAGNNVPRELRGGLSSSSDGTSVSETDSTSGSDSENERERKAERARRREQIIAEKAAAKAVEAINERENIVARLEGEKQSLEKILEERAKQQAQEASDLQMSMMETMEAAELEKLKHNNTRMEALVRLAKLETANADLARSLATTQWNLEIEGNRVAELRQQIELKEAAHKELRKRMSTIHQGGSSLNKLEALKGAEFEREILEAEYSLTCDKIGQFQEKAKKLEENIEITRKEIENPTEVEIELKRRLAQLTDHLIQKQSQVEDLSSEKAMILFRIETVSRLLDEHKSSLHLPDLAGPSFRDDLEAGTREMSNSKPRPLFVERIESGSRRHFGSLIQQLDAIFSAGAAFIRRNSSAKISSIVYLVCLHCWVLYILRSHSQVSDIKSGAVISLESINKTSGS